MRYTKIYDYTNMLEEICTFSYLASNTVTVTLFTENDSSCLLEDESISKGLLPRQYPGVLGWGIVAVSLLNINTAEDIVGLSSARSWTHKRPTCMHLKTSQGLYELPTDESSTSSPFPSFHFLHTCNVPVQCFVDK